MSESKDAQEQKIDSKQQSVNTGGGAYIGGNVNTGGGSFVGRDQPIRGDTVQGDKIEGDKIEVGNISGGTGIAIGRGAQSTVLTTELSEELMESVLQPLIDAENAAGENTSYGEEIKAELIKGADADDFVIAQRLEQYAEAAPNAVKHLFDVFESPLVKGIEGPATRYVLKKLASNSQ